MWCAKHPKESPNRFKVIFKTTTKRFRSHEAAYRFLTVLRYQVDGGTYDPREYRKDYPIGFSTLVEKWLPIKKDEVRPKTYRDIEHYMVVAQAHWGNKNVKEIDYGEFEDFLRSLNMANKTKHNVRSILHDFWVWLKKRKYVGEIPDFPKISFELGMRRTVSKEVQGRILEEVERIAGFNPRIYLGIRFLATYIAVRPGELLRAKEKDFDLDGGFLLIPSPKERRPKTVPLLTEDVATVRGLLAGTPELPFFRHEGGVQGTRAGQPFGFKYLYKWWKRACGNLGIEGVDLYGGTRHSSARALRKYRTPEEIKRASMHSTNKAFDRYFQIESDGLREIYSDALYPRLPFVSPDKVLEGHFDKNENYNIAKSGHKLVEAAGVEPPSFQSLCLFALLLTRKSGG